MYRRLLTAAFCCAIAASGAIHGAEPCAKKAVSSGKCLKGKVMAVCTAAKAQDLAKAQAAAKEACAAMAKHKPTNPDLCAKTDYQKMEACATAAIKKVSAAQTAEDAAAAAGAIMGTCKACHAKYKPK